MKVSFSCSLKPKSGKQNFAIRLAHAFRKYGVQITNKSKINLVFVSGVKRGCKNILRLDNAWINSQINSKAKNKKITQTMRKCDGVIYQSQYSKKICQKFIGKHKKSTIIFNGCSPTVFKKKYTHSKPYILSFSRWRPHKRLKQTIEGFLNSGLQERYDLIICGNADYRVDHKAVIYKGRQSTFKMQQIVSGSKFIVHLAFMDCCPNSVVESLVAGKNILYANSGGMKELVGKSGVCIPDRSYFKMIELYKPPHLNMEELVAGYRKIEQLETKPVRKDLFIDKVARQYISYMRKFL